ncbi:MAG: polymer-forming cytoskeletal protein [Gammaproteobacteria bacterium]|nr:polymer-forming cytoskeletal protein [Gammaproteobacteria bacterium]
MLNPLGKSHNEKPCNTIETLVGARTELKGDLTFSGGLRIDGKLKGNVTAKGDGNSTLILSENALIIGNVTVPHIIINGTIKGTVRAAERIELQPKAEITGDVYYKVMEMASGAAINGNLLRESIDTNREKAPVARLKPIGSGAMNEEEA